MSTVTKCNGHEAAHYENSLLSGLLSFPELAHKLEIKSRYFVTRENRILAAVAGSLADIPTESPAFMQELKSRLQMQDVDGLTAWERLDGARGIARLLEAGGFEDERTLKLYVDKLREAADKRELEVIAADILAGKAGESEQIRELLQLTIERQQRSTGQRQRTFEGDDASDLEELEGQAVDWIVLDVFGIDQPTIFGGASKVLKTTQLADLSVAFGTQTKWLNHFIIPKRRKVLFITGESTKRAMAKRIGRAIRIRDLSWNDIKGWLHIEAMDFPQLPSATDLIAIRRTVQKHSFEVVIIDPLYRGLNGLDTNRMGEIASAIIEFSKTCAGQTSDTF